MQKEEGACARTKNVNAETGLMTARSFLKSMAFNWSMPKDDLHRKNVA